MTGEKTQEATMLPTFDQWTTPSPPAATPKPTTPPTMECVVDTGRPVAVAI